MEETILKSFMELGTTGAFLVYLYIRNGRQEKSMNKVSDALDKINEAQERHTRVLIKVSEKHGMMTDADKLIEE